MRGAHSYLSYLSDDVWQYYMEERYLFKLSVTPHTVDYYPQAKNSIIDTVTDEVYVLRDRVLYDKAGITVHTFELPAQTLAVVCVVSNKVVVKYAYITNNDERNKLFLSNAPPVVLDDKITELRVWRDIIILSTQAPRRDYRETAILTRYELDMNNKLTRVGIYNEYEYRDPTHMYRDKWGMLHRNTIMYGTFVCDINYRPCDIKFTHKYMGDKIWSYRNIYFIYVCVVDKQIIVHAQDTNGRAYKVYEMEAGQQKKFPCGGYIDGSGVVHIYVAGMYVRWSYFFHV